MSSSRSHSWSITQVPVLDLTSPFVEVDIGFLGGDDHRRAFVAIFRKVLADNAKRFSDLQLTALVARRPVSLPAVGLTTLPVDLVTLERLDAFPSGLYDSGNEKVLLQLTGPQSSWELGVTFDNPRFWFSTRAS